ncbi:FIST N-terminal domain-containing protein [Croceicoccus gelatinilyticus]|uniref:FIST N-terminal domain-containing protein n=1 Tax=Croceicoccus gelatinilyticus TaxID=2835536 RepID=UPI001BCAFCD2|nr:FIST C-terminal domain-containing protein [Croceicoccus gelatinilyticus]
MSADGLVAVTTHASEPEAAVAEIARAIAGVPLAGGLVFCSHRFERAKLAKALDKLMPGVPLFGCTSAGELTTRGYDSDSIVFVGFPADAFHLELLPFTDLDSFDTETARKQVRHFAGSCRNDAALALGEGLSHVALFLVDGLSHREELLTMTAQEALGEIELIGGSSGDGLAFKETGIFFDGHFQRDAAVIGLLSSSRPMQVFSANHYRPGGERMVITEADAETRTAFEINAVPAAEEYLRVVGQPSQTLDAAFFASHPLMVRTGGEYHVRSIQSANADGSLTFYCAIDRGVVMTVGEPVDRVAAMRDLFDKTEGKVGKIDHIIAFDCVLNRIDAERRQVAHEVSALYTEKGVIGFNTYGEQLRTAHVNQTFSGLAIGR